MTKLQVGVKALLSNGNGKFLLLKRSSEKYSEIEQLWDLVGGRIDPGDSLLENLEREIAEETGLKLEGHPNLIAAQDIIPNEELHVVRLTYVARVTGTDVRLSEEHTDYRWLTFDEITALEDLDRYFSAILDEAAELITKIGSDIGKAGRFTSNSTYFRTTDALEKGRNREIRLDENFVKLDEETDRNMALDKDIVRAGQRGEVDNSGTVHVEQAPISDRSKLSRGRLGKLGEDLAACYLEDRGFEVVERNYRKKWGEIDIIARKNNILRFVEVKAGVSREKGSGAASSISRGTDEYRPEEHVHPKKIERLHRAIQTYLAERREEDKDWQLDVLAVDIDTENMAAHCRFIENVI